MNASPLFVALLALLFLCCERQPTIPSQVTADESTAETFCGRCKPCAWHLGERDAERKLVVFKAGGLCKTLESDYALAFLNSGDETNPVAHYDFSSQETGYQTFRTLDALMARIERIREPRIIDFYGTCGAPPFSGLPDRDVQAFFEAMKSANVELRTERPDGSSNTICTCPCKKCK
jgi:hypothetical protein